MRGIPALFAIKLSSAHVSVEAVISRAISECLPNEIMQTCSPSNKVGLFLEIQPRLFPVELDVRARVTTRGRCGAFGSSTPLCFSLTVVGTVLCSFFFKFSLSCRGDVHAPCIPLCNGMCGIWELCRQSDNSGIRGPILWIWRISLV